MDFNPLAAGLAAPFFATYLYSVLSSYGILLSLWQKADIASDKAVADDTQTHFDFIIVGAGTAGGLISHRLSKKFDVLLLEAGGEPSPLTRIPGFYDFLLNYPESDWKYRTVPQENACHIARNHQCTLSAGIGLGGTGNINALVHMRGHSKDFDAWGNITQDPSWNFDGVLPYFKSNEYLAIKNDPKINMNFHGTEGDMHLERPEFTGLADVFTAAAAELGYPNVDLNGDVFGEGFDGITLSTKHGSRHIPFAAYIEPARREQDLKVRKFALVTKILFDNDSVKGVEYIRHGKTYKVFARKEVILSAGAFGTPKILMSSGIGPKEHLKELGITLLKDLPVGKRLLDHVGTKIGPIFVNRPPIPTPDVKEFTKWISEGKGVLSSTNHDATGFVTSSIAKSNGEGGWPDIQFYMINGPSYETSLEVGAQALDLKLDELQRFFKHQEHPKRKASFSVAICLGRPKSVGYVQLGGSNVYDSLKIDPNYLNPNVNEGSDRKILLEGIKTALMLIENTTAFQNIEASLPNVRFPGCEHFLFRSEKYFDCYITRLSWSFRHYCGTAAMGKEGDPNSVVDSKLKVIGIKGLRIADASVFPTIVFANIQAPILMVAQKASEMILKEWQLPNKVEL